MGGTPHNRSREHAQLAAGEDRVHLFRLASRLGGLRLVCRRAARQNRALRKRVVPPANLLHDDASPCCEHVRKNPPERHGHSNTSAVVTSAGYATNCEPEIECSGISAYPPALNARRHAQTLPRQRFVLSVELLDTQVLDRHVAYSRIDKTRPATAITTAAIRRRLVCRRLPLQRSSERPSNGILAAKQPSAGRPSSLSSLSPKPLIR